MTSPETSHRPTAAEVITPLAMQAPLTYRIPASLAERVKVGSRVVVPVGQRKFYTGIVLRLHDEAPKDFALKEIADAPDERPLVLPSQLYLWQFLSHYYICTLGEVMKAALPAGLKLESESVIRKSDHADQLDLTDKTECAIMLALQDDEPMPISHVAKQIGRSNIIATVRRLLEKGAITMHEAVRHHYKPKTEIRLRLNEAYFDRKALEEAERQLQRAPKQMEVLHEYLRLAEAESALRLRHYALLKAVKKADVMKAVPNGSNAISSLCERNILEAYKHETGRLQHRFTEGFRLNVLNEAQQQAVSDITDCFRTKNVCLLHGVTSSGKTEVYIELIEQTLKAGKQVLYLVPEIALTTQITTRLGRIFGSTMGVYHSKFPDAERVEIWQKQCSDQPFRLILGVRSSLFLPFQDLGLIIVDEEHETSYKQQDPAPRYHARDAAMVLGSHLHAKVLLGTATPAVETYHHALSGKYGLVEMHERFGAGRLPLIEVVNIIEQQQQRRMAGPFSSRLTEAVSQALDRREQAILFINRRGYAPQLTCTACGWTPRCHRCDVSLTFHLAAHRLVCHYCGASFEKPARCPNCESETLRDTGFGTEKIEESVQTLWPEARLARMDLDTTRTQTAYEKIIDDFQKHKTDILIGTQMVTKGLDFDRVSVVGILNADTTISLPDFRAHERAFQMMAQVAGRAGRRQTQGLVILQTRQPSLPLISQICTNDYRAMYEQQLSERKQFHYPPFCRLIYIYMKHRDDATVQHASLWLAAYLRTGFGERVLGPDRPFVGRIQSLNIRKMMIKIEPSASLAKVRAALMQALDALHSVAAYKSVNVYFDADPNG